jgi:hypothetical protein
MLSPRLLASKYSPSADPSVSPAHVVFGIPSKSPSPLLSSQRSVSLAPPLGEESTEALALVPTNSTQHRKSVSCWVIIWIAFCYFILIFNCSNNCPLQKKFLIGLVISFPIILFLRLCRRRIVREHVPTPDSFRIQDLGNRDVVVGRGYHDRDANRVLRAEVVRQNVRALVSYFQWACTFFDFVYWLKYITFNCFKNWMIRAGVPRTKSPLEVFWGDRRDWWDVVQNAGPNGTRG